MADYESNVIKPVEGLQTVPGLAPAKQREERKRRQPLHHENEESAEDKDTQQEEQTEGEGGRAGSEIDYCA
jgi:hypothetical protein